MKHIKKFETLNSANGFITPKPFVGTVQQENGIISTNQVSKLIVENNKLDSAIIITGIWNPTITNNTKKVIISGNVELNGKTDCYSVTFEENSCLTINEGARLRVWQGGIIGSTSDNFVIKEDAANNVYAELLIHPDCTIGNHPLATYKFKSIAKQNGDGTCLWQRFSIPSFNSAMTMNWENDVRSGIVTIDYSTGDWVLIHNGYSPFILNADPCRAFQCHEMTVDVTKQISYNLILELIGNTNTQINLDDNWNYFANSYTSFIKTKALYNWCVNNNLNNLLILSAHGTTNWITVTNENVDTISNITPMLGFIIHSPSAKTLTLDYKTLCWDPSFEEEVTPTRGLMKGSNNTLLNENIDIIKDPESPFIEDKPIEK